jgi:hypothetical protein
VPVGLDRAFRRICAQAQDSRHLNVAAGRRGADRYAALDCGRHTGSLAVTEACIEALHSAREIRQRLQKLGVREIDVLDALYTERRWSRAIERRACGDAITAYERVRGDGPSVVPQEDL